MNPKTAVKTLTFEDLKWVFKTFGKITQLYSFTPANSGETLHVDVTKLLADLQSKNIRDVDFRYMALTDDLYDTVMRTQGIEVARLQQITPDRAANQPVLVLEQSPDSHIIMDGNHGLCKAYQMGLRKKPAIFVTPEYIKPFLHTPPDRVQEFIKICNKENVQFAKIIVEEIQSNPSLAKKLKKVLGDESDEYDVFEGRKAYACNDNTSGLG